MAAGPKPLLLIQARNLITNLALPGFLTDEEGGLLYFNDAAAEVIGRRFEEVGPLPRDGWAKEFGPFDHEGHPLAVDHQPFAQVLRKGRPAQGRFFFRFGEGNLREVEVSAIPMLEPDNFEGALIVFWPVEDGAELSS
jgi:PAS domain-containing protein